MNWLLHVTGVDDLTGRWYGFWSGFGSDLAYLGIIAALYRKYNCHVRGCWRIGRHHVEGTTHTVCRKHHPDDHLRAEHLSSDT